MSGTRKEFTKVALEPDAARQLRELSLRLTGVTGRRISMSTALVMLIKDYSENAQFLERFGMTRKEDQINE